MAPFVTFLSDYGTTGEFVGVIHGVIARLCPEARVIDIGHGIPRQAVEIAARVLRRSLLFMPAGVHLAVVDTPVGSGRVAVALRVAEQERLLVGPDNGLLIPVAERFGGVVQAVDISDSPWCLDPVSATFHGRDVFAPVTARLAAGAPLAEAGTPLVPSELRRIDLSRARRDPDGNLIAHAVEVDGFGNVALDGGHGDVVASGWSLGQHVRLTVRDHVHRVVFALGFADAQPGEPLLYEDSAGGLALAVNGGSAANVLELRVGEPVTLAR
jgi:S-adenosylmethionine hydrolase